MSSAHYQGPASLPSDYALLSRIAGHYPDGEEQVRIESEEEESEEEEENRPISTIVRRRSMPAPSDRPSHPTVCRPLTYPNFPMPGPIASENTPLLNPPVPRIEEPLEQTPDSGKTLLIFWEELRILTRYALPVFGTHILEFSLIMTSVISIGHLSTTALAAISLGSMTANVTAFSVIQGFTSALDTMLPSAWTSSQPQLVGLWTQRMVVVMAFLLVPMYFIWFNAEGILLSLKQDPEVARLAALYLRWVSIGLPAYAFNCVSRRYFQSQGLFAVPTQIIFIVAPLNVILNYVLVWGPQQIRLGFIGAPIATAFSFNLVSLMSIIYGVIYVPRTAWYPLSRRMFTSLGVLVQLGLAGVGQTASEWWAWELVALAASLLGPVALATQSVLLVSASTTFQAPFALSVATSVRIGNLLGEGKAQRAGIASNTSIIMALALSAASSTMFLVFRNSWAYLFNNDPGGYRHNLSARVTAEFLNTEVVTLVASIIPLVALFQVFDGNAAVTAGILRARGKQASLLFPLYAVHLLMRDLLCAINSSYYIIGIPFGMWLTFSRDMKLHGLWIGLTVSLVYCSFFGTLLCLRTDWNREVWKVMQRLKEQDKAHHHHIEVDEESGITQQA
ncbi:hypothetical protein D9615_006162 [Tricholomella constricta]|uniref:MATE efflux family protein n=1 Tax=Tricholomella constricta TaxID=117010 RepID=A0A8H5HBE4_9AGAR|nr:hypothetical protein D9615_006162 [Tricholomella constricta]